jgi:hypothetical protein
MKTNQFQLRFGVLFAILVLANALFPTVAAAQAIQFSGSATAVDARVLGLQPITLGATGEVPATGGELEKSEVAVDVPGLLNASFLSSSVVARGNRSHAESTVADLSITAGGNTIGARVLHAEAEAKCNGSAATVSGSAEIAELVVNGQTIAVTGAPNQRVPLPIGEIIINKQEMQVQGETGDINVTALYLDIPGVGTVAIATVHADIRCKGQPACPDDGDFVTGGGWIETQTASRGTFAVAGGKRPGWGHLNYIDHGTRMRIKGTAVLVYTPTGVTSRHIEGTCENSNGGGCYYLADVNDVDEPGRLDTFSLELFNAPPSGADTPFYSAANLLSGGNIQLHDQCGKK